MKHPTQQRKLTQRLGAHLFALFVMLTALAFAAVAQQDSVLPVSKEPHHHLEFQNGYVQLFRVHATYGDSVLMHRHEYDMLSIQQGATDTTVHYPDKPDLHQAISDGQLRFQLAGLVHSTEVMKADQPFDNSTIALLHPQTNKRNLCAVILAGEPMNCPPALLKEHGEIPQFASDQTLISVILLPPHQEIARRHPGQPELVISLRDAEVECRTGSDAKHAKIAKTLRERGDFAWIELGENARVFANHSDQDVWLVTLLMKQ